MPIIALQRRLAEAGRIRIGQQVPTGNGRSRPSKLEKFRFTSANAEAIEQIAERWGGKPQDWESPNGTQREVYTDASAIEVAIPPGDMAFSQWREMWSGGGCQRRCDGIREQNTDGPCLCPEDPAERQALAQKGQACKDTTRLSVILPDLEGVGLWRIESHGYYAAVELGGAVELLQSLAPGRLVPGRLWLDKRSDKVKVGDKVQTNRYVVPVLDIKGRLSELAPGPHASVALAAPIENGNGIGQPGLTPVPAALPAAPAPSIASQVAGVNNDRPPSTRANAQQPIPATGLEPGPIAAGEGSSAATSGGRPSVPPSPEGATYTLDDLREILADTPGWAEGKALKRARAIAGELGEPLPNQFDQITGTVLDALCAELNGTPDGGGGGGRGGPPPDEGAVPPAPQEASPGAPAAEPEHAGTGQLLAWKERDGKGWKSANRRMQGIANGSKSKGIRPVLSADATMREHQRHALMHGCSRGRVSSWSDATETEMRTVEEWLGYCARGRVEWLEGQDGWPGGLRPQLRSANRGAA